VSPTPDASHFISFTNSAIIPNITITINLLPLVATVKTGFVQHHQYIILQRSNSPTMAIMPTATESARSMSPVLETEGEHHHEERKHDSSNGLTSITITPSAATAALIPSSIVAEPVAQSSRETAPPKLISNVRSSRAGAGKSNSSTSFNSTRITSNLSSVIDVESDDVTSKRKVVNKSSTNTSGTIISPNTTTPNSAQLLLADLDPRFEEVRKAKALSVPARATGLFRRKDKLANLKNIRTRYQLQRESQRQSRKTAKTNFALKLFRLVLDRLWRSFVDMINGPGPLITFMILDLISDILFCVLYLVEIQFNVANADKDEYLATKTPRWLWTSRPAFIFTIAFYFSVFNLVSLGMRIVFADNKIKALFNWFLLVGMYILCLKCLLASATVSHTAFEES
jgi:hypothetical protein